MSFPIDTHDGQVMIVDTRHVIGTAITTVLTDEDGKEWTQDPRTNRPVYVPVAEAEAFVKETEAALDEAEKPAPKSRSRAAKKEESA